MEKLLVTQQQYGKGRQVFETCTDFECIEVPADEAHLCEAIKSFSARYVVVGMEPYGDALYKALAGGGVIARYGVGHDNIDKQLATRYRVLCTNTPGVLHDSVAEYTIGLILAACRYIPAQHQQTHTGGWAPIRGMELKGKTVAVIGCGTIGAAVARMLKIGFGCRIVVFDTDLVRRQQLKSASYVDEVAETFEEAVARADIVTLHIPGSLENRHFIHAERLAAMRSSAWLINTARGNVVDEKALHDVLSARDIAGAALDVFEQEPYRPVSTDHDLRKLDNVLLLPHSASNTLEACSAMAESVLNNIRLAARGQYKGMNIVNIEVLKALDSDQ